jgi:hypothetical protein
MHENSMTGVERAHCRISHPEAAAVAMKAEDLDLIMAESAKSDFQRAMERFVTSETGSARAHCLLWPSQSAAQEKGVAQEPMMAREEKASEIAEHRQLHGARDVHKARKMDQDHLDANSRNDLLLNVLPLLLSKIANGEQRCDPMRKPPNPQSPLAKVARRPHLQLLRLRH